MNPASELERAPLDPDVQMRAKLQAEATLAPAIDTMRTLSEILKAPVVLAGGAIRDALLERPIKDYDLFTSHLDEWEEVSEYTTKVATACGIPVDSIKVLYQYDEDETPFGQEVECIMSWFHPDNGTEVQLIFLRHFTVGVCPHQFTDRLDFNICRGALTLDGWAIDQRFWDDVAGRCMTFEPDRENLSSLDFDRSARRFLRLSQKYPGYGLRKKTYVEAGELFHG